MWLRLKGDTRTRRYAAGLAIYAVVTAVVFACASPGRFLSHTPWNHFSLQAEAWLSGRVDLGGAPPSYATNNDFARFGDKWFVVFPPFPAVLLVPLVKLGGSAVRVQDGQFFMWLAGLAPAVLFLGLEKLRRTERSERSQGTNAALSMLFAFGTVYFFTAEQGTVWYAAHVVGTALAALYLLFSLDAERPWLAGLALGLGFMTRSPLLFAVPLFVIEAVRVSLRAEDEGRAASGGRIATALGWARRIDFGKLSARLTAFAVPVLLVLVLALWYNRVRFGNPFDFGYAHLQITWKGRVEKWGLFNYHYLAKNLGVVLTSLPWWTKGGAAPFQINTHGLALWVTSPFYLWALWPKRTGVLHWAVVVTLVAVAVPTLLYQNTGWTQFGYRFSNDYAPFIIVLLAIGARRLGIGFAIAAVVAIAVNAFGALTFERGQHGRFYHQDNSQQILYERD